MHEKSGLNKHLRMPIFSPLFFIVKYLKNILTVLYIQVMMEA